MKRITDKLVGIEAVTEAYKRANADLKDICDEHDVLVNERKDLTALKTALDEASDEESSWEAEHKKELKQFEVQIAALKPIDVKTLDAVVTSALQRSKTAEKAYEESHRTLGEARGAVSAAEKEQERLFKLTGNLATAGSKCSKCGTAVTASNIAAHQREMEEQLAEAVEATKTAKAEEAAAKKEFDARRDAWEEAKKKHATASKNARDAAAETTKVDTIKEMFDKLKAQTNPHGKAVKRAQEALDTAKAHNVTVDKALEDVKSEMEKLRFIVTMFSDKGDPSAPPLKSLLVESVAPFVNKKLASYSRVLTEGNFRITFETQSQLKSGEYRDTYSIKVVNRFGASAYEGSSGGEKRKIDASIFFAFQALAASRSREQVRFAVWDEVFDALDETAQEVMMDLLLEEKKTKDTMLVITQRPELRGYFPRAIKVIKENGCSRVA